MSELDDIRKWTDYAKATGAPFVYDRTVEAHAHTLLRIATEQEAELTKLRAERDKLREALELMLRRYGYETCEYVQKALAALGEAKHE